MDRQSRGHGIIAWCFAEDLVRKRQRPLCHVMSVDVSGRVADFIFRVRVDTMAVLGTRYTRYSIHVKDQGPRDRVGHVGYVGYIHYPHSI